MKLEKIRVRNTFHAGSLAMVCAALAMAGGCAGGSDVDVPDAEAVGRDEQAATHKAIWTRFISEEDGQSNTSGAHCPANMAVVGFDCSGDFCDNVRLRCDTFPGLGASRWTHWVEHSGTQAKCGTNEWMTGVRCWGDNCDNVGIECSASDNAAVNCGWTPDWYSEESGAYTTPPGRYIQGVECAGRHCDNKRYWVCGTRPPAANSCAGHCGAGAGGGTCWCDPACLTYGDCCTDYERVCL